MAENLAERRSPLPLELANYVVQIASDTNITSIVQVRLAAYLARHADDDYSIHDPDPRRIGEKLGYAQAPIYKALAALESRGYIEWRRASGHERHTGKSGSVRILIPAQS